MQCQKCSYIMIFKYKTNNEYVWLNVRVPWGSESHIGYFRNVENAHLGIMTLVCLWQPSFIKNRTSLGWRMKREPHLKYHIIYGTIKDQLSTWLARFFWVRFNSNVNYENELEIRVRINRLLVSRANGGNRGTTRGVTMLWEESWNSEHTNAKEASLV